MKNLLVALLFSLNFYSGYSQADIQKKFDQALHLYKLENFKKSIAAFIDVLNEATDTEMKKFCYIYRAFAYDGLRQYREAIEDLNSAIELDPLDVASYIDRGQIKGYAGDLEGAKNDFVLVLS